MVIWLTNKRLRERPHARSSYGRQFITGDNANKGILEPFETLLNDFFTSDKPQEVGLPPVVFLVQAN